MRCRRALCAPRAPSAPRPDDHDPCRRRPRARHRAGEEVRPVRPPLHVLPDRGPLPRRIPGRALRQRAARAQRAARRASAAAVAVRARAVLQHHLLLLRLQQGHHQGPRPQREIHQVRRPRDRDHRRHDRGRARRRAAAPGRRHADVPRPRRDGRPDGDAARRVPRRARRRDLDRGRSAQGRRRHRRVPRAARIQPDLGRRPGLRSGGPEGGQPHPVRGRDAHGDRRVARQRLRLGQLRPDLRAAEADGGRIFGARSTR